VVHAALDLGINFFDTANVYGATPTFDRPGAPPATEREPAKQILGRAAKLTVCAAKRAVYGLGDHGRLHRSTLRPRGDDMHATRNATVTPAQTGPMRRVAQTHLRRSWDLFALSMRRQ
jgi:aryl-alcohol dehydrogenase-like predicted oxidoreductase